VVSTVVKFIDSKSGTEVVIGWEEGEIGVTNQQV
jgi:hypothetical protein